MTLYELVRQKEYAGMVRNQDYPGIADALNAREEIPNPERQEVVPKRFELSDLFERIHSEDKPAIRDVPEWLFNRIESALAENDRVKLAIHLEIVADLLPNSMAAISAMFSITEPDPDYKATILSESIAAQNGLRSVTARQVQAVLT